MFDMSLFIRLDCSFFRHRKTIRLRSIIGDAALWVPPALWTYAAEHQPDGDFSDYSDSEMALSIGYLGDAPSMLQALLKSEFLDDDMKLHDWESHNGYHKAHQEKARKAAEARWGKERSKEKTERTEENRGEESARARRSALCNASSNAPSMLQASSHLERPDVGINPEVYHPKPRGLPHQTQGFTPLNPEVYPKAPPNISENKVEIKEEGISAPFLKFKEGICGLFDIPLNEPWGNSEEHYLVDVFRRDNAEEELESIVHLYSVCDRCYLPRNPEALLLKWSGTVTRARHPEHETAKEEKKITNAI